MPRNKKKKSSSLTPMEIGKIASQSKTGSVPIDLWNKWVTANPKGSPNNPTGITMGEWMKSKGYNKYPDGGKLGRQYLLDKKGNVVNFRYGSLTENPEIQNEKGESGYYADWSKPVGPDTKFGDYKFGAKGDDNVFLTSSPMEGYTTVFVGDGDEDPYADSEVLTQSIYSKSDKIKDKFYKKHATVQYYGGGTMDALSQSEDAANYAASGTGGGFNWGAAMQGATAAGNVMSQGQQDNPYNQQFEGQQAHSGIREGVASAIPIAGAFHAVGKGLENSGQYIDSDKQRGAKITQSMFSPSGANIELLQNEEATGGEKALGLTSSVFLGAGPWTGLINDKVMTRAENKQKMKDYKASKSNYAGGGPYPQRYDKKPLPIKSKSAKGGGKSLGKVTRYDNGGGIDVGEQVVYGSPRWHEIQELEKQQQAYQTQMDYLSSQGLNSLTPINRSTLESRFPDHKLDIPEGASSFYQLPKGTEGYELVNTDKGVNVFSQDGQDYLTGTASPVDVPNYDVTFDETDYSLEPEKIYQPIEGTVTKGNSGNPVTKTIGYTYGYEGDPIDESTFQTKDPYTGEQLVNPGQSYSVPGTGINYEYTTPNPEVKEIKSPSVQMLGRPQPGYEWRQDESGQYQQYKKGTFPTVELHATGGKINDYDNGGRFVNYEGPDHANGGINVDKNGLPTLAQTQDEVEGGETMYDNDMENYIFSDRILVDTKSKKTYADVSKSINKKYSKNADKISETTEKLELEHLKQEQEEFRQGMSDKKAAGGKHPDGGAFPQTQTYYEQTEYQPIASTYGYSVPREDSLGKYTSRYSTPKVLPVSNEYLQTQKFKDSNGLLQARGLSKEELLENASLPQNTKAYNQAISDKLSAEMSPKKLYNKAAGGKMKYNYGGTGPQTEEEARRSNSSMYPIADEFGYFQNLSSNAPGYIPVGTQPYMMPDLNLGNEVKPNTGRGTIDYIDITEPYVAGTTPQEYEQSDINNLPQDKINPAGYIASNVGNIYDLIQAGKKRDKNDFGRAELERMDFDPERTALRNEAAKAQAIARENARSSASSGAAMTNQVIANALINSNLGKGLSDSFMREANINSQISNQEELTNTQIEMQEKLADQQDEMHRRSVASKALHDMGMNTQGYVKDLTAAKVGNMNNEMWFELVRKGKHTEHVMNKEGMPIQVVKGTDGKYFDISTKKEVKVDSKGNIID